MGNERSTGDYSRDTGRALQKSVVRENLNIKSYEHCMGAFMRKANYLLIPVILLLADVAFGQIIQGSFLPHKELIFPQIAAGGQYQTWVTVTNRGVQPWSGTLNFYTSQGVAWNPVVNGSQISGGILAVQIVSKGTNTFKITLPGNTQAGYLIATTNNIALDNFLEGNLTYYVSDEGGILDAVGILPSSPISAGSIPFEDFSTLSFAVANAKSQGRTATVTMKLYTDSNAQVGSLFTLPLTAGAYAAQYLWDAFPTAPKTSWRGRLEIESNVPVSMVALSQAAGGQLSSLPLAATTRTYSITSTSSYAPFAQMTLWAEGLFVGGYGVAARYPDLFGLFGQIAADGSLHVHFDGNSAATDNVEIFGYLKTNESYRPGMTSFTGTYWIYTPSAVYSETGTFTATLIP
jgi:hypothetical protein